MKHLEDQLQEQCVQWFRLKYKKEIIYAVPNGGNRNVREAVRFKRQGVLAGVPDLFIPRATSMFHGFYVELKIGKNKLSKKQREIADHLISSGYGFKICRTFDEFVDAIDYYMGDK